MPANIPDFSVLDSIVGVVTGVILIGIPIVLGIKYRIINIGATPPVPSITPPNQTFCAACQAEHERSLANKAGIEKLDGEFSSFKRDIFQKLDDINNGVTEIRVTVAEMKKSR